MKRFLSILLALALLATAFPIAAFAEDALPAWWGTIENTIKLKDGPTIIRIEADSNDAGTRAQAHFSNTAGFRALGAAYAGAHNSSDRLFARILGMDEELVEGALDTQVQLAYSFDGSTWVNDWETDPDAYYIETYFDRDEDGFEEYSDLPGGGENLHNYYDTFTIFDGRAGCFTPGYCNPADGMSINFHTPHGVGCALALPEVPSVVTRQNKPAYEA